MAGSRSHAISFAIETASTVMSSSGVFGQWAFGIGQPRRDRHGRMAIVRGSSARSGGNALTMLSCLVSGIFVKCFNLMRTTTIKLERTYRWTRMRRYHTPSRPSAAFCPCQSWADCTTNMSGFSFRQGHRFTDSIKRELFTGYDPIEEGLLPEDKPGSGD